MMGFKLSDNKIIAILIIALIVQVILLLWHIGIIRLQSLEGERTNVGTLAGQIIKAHNNLRRRPLNSLVWENTKRQESVFYYDSMLTLSQSSATLKLSNGTDVHLSENTLIVLEPPEEKRQGEIRLKFLKGNFRSRNTFAKTIISHEHFVINVNKNSEIDVRQVEDDEFEVKVEKGTAQLITKEGKKEISSSNYLRIENGVSSIESVDISIKWTSIPQKRVYTHSPEISLDLAWKGQVNFLVLQTMGDKEKIFVTRGQNQKAINLKHGDHRLFLKKGNQRSQVVSIQVWQAPKIHLVRPLPRDRVLFKDTQFLWTPNEKSESYVLKIEGLAEEIKKETTSNELTVPFSEKGDAQWSVWGKDIEGFLIPPLYKNKIFIRKNPFSAPKLNRPILIEPKKGAPDSASLWDLLIPKAYGQEIFEALFTWEKVSEATKYWIEISEDPSFFKPIVQETTNKNQFLWSNINVKKIYYWRVAAGNSSGRMGVFSPPEKVDPKPAQKSKPKDIQKKIGITKKKIPQPKIDRITKIQKEKQDVSKSDIREIKESPKKNIFVEKEDESVEESKWQWFPAIFWTPSYQFLKIKAPEEVEASLSGLSLINFSIQNNFIYKQKSLWNLTLEFNQAKFKPKRSSSIQLQGNLLGNFGKFYGYHKSLPSMIGYGFILQMMPLIKRKTFETIESEDHFVYGLSLHLFWELYIFKMHTQFSPLVSDQFTGAGLTQTMTTYPLGENLPVGIKMDSLFLTGASRQQIETSGYLVLGYAF